MNKLLLTLATFVLVLTAQAQTPTPTKTTTVKTTTTTTTTEVTPEKEKSTLNQVKDVAAESVQVATEALDSSARTREKRDYGFFLIYSPIDLLIPGKIGGSFYLTSDDKRNQYEISYLRSSLSLNSTYGSADVASMTEQKLSFLNRNFSQGSNFNWFYGLSYAALESRLGKDYINSLPPGSAGHDPDLLQVDVLALDIGIGNRWFFDNGLSLGVDWVGVTQPIATLKNKQTFTDQTTSQSDKDDVDKFLKFITSFPRIYTLKMQVGYSF